MSQQPPQPPQWPGQGGQGPGGQPPLPLGYSTPAGGAVDLKKIALQQRGIILCILSIIILYVLIFTVGRGGPPIIMAVFGLVYLGVVITAAVFTFMLAISVYNTGMGIVMGIFSLVPCIGVLVLLAINGKATTILRAHGIKVGLLGADPSKIP
jgi:hypothetical protein